MHDGEYKMKPNRRTFLASSAALPAAMQTSRPNILFLMAGQHRADCVGADGNAVIHTPNLDRIAKQGIRFRCAYSSTPTCTPARAALLTGLSPWHHGLLGTGPIAQKYAFTLPQALRDAGYYTQVVGKCHYAPQRDLHGFHHAILDESGRAASGEFRSDYRAWFYSEAPKLDPDATGVGFNDYKGKPYVLPERLRRKHAPPGRPTTHRSASLTSRSAASWKRWSSAANWRTR
jgi:arylsulfatase A-like enzyme